MNLQARTPRDFSFENLSLEDCLVDAVCSSSSSEKLSASGPCSVSASIRIWVRSSYIFDPSLHGGDSIPSVTSFPDSADHFEACEQVDEVVDLPLFDA